jgi:hypothetical protein
MVIAPICRVKQWIMPDRIIEKDGGSGSALTALAIVLLEAVSKIPLWLFRGA